MSQDSPSKHERIERHLMRQRGAGSRTVNANFGFSFAGFSAPSSQDATPSALPEAPAAKRRKTVAEDVGKELEEATSGALERRGKTKAARAKRRFVDHAVEEQARSRQEAFGDGEDSFVTGVGVKKRAKGARSEERHRAADVNVDRRQEGAEIGREEEAQGVASKPKGKRKGKKGADTAEGAVDPLLNEVESATAAKQMPTAKKRAPRNVKRGVSPDAGGASEEGIEDVAPTSRKKATRKTKTPAPGKLEEEVIPEIVAPATKKVRARRRVKSTVSGIEQPAVDVPPVDDVNSLGPTNIEICDSTRLDAPKPHRKRKGQDDTGEKPPADASQKRPLSILHEDNVPAPSKRSEKAAPKIADAKKTVLDRTPPQLERRPLQEGDVNRSPSPRKSPEKLGQDAKARSKGIAKSSKRKCKITSEDQTLAEGGPRKARKLMVQQDDPPAGIEEGDAAPGSPKHRSVEDMEPEQQPSPKEQKSAKTARPTRPPKANLSKPFNEPAAETKACTASKKHQGEGEDDDVDWLFAAPETKPKTVSRAPSAKPVAAPRKMKLADIDLDDLLANVAAFAQSGNPDPITSSACTGSRKTKRR